MDRRYVIAGTPEVRISIRVRGMSQHHRFFDEQTFTTHVTSEFIVMRLHDEVDLDSEVHITNMRTQVGGTYRVAWTQPRPDEGVYAVGLELLEPEGEMWEPDSIPQNSDGREDFPAILLQCQRCSGRMSVPIPEAELESLGEGFIIAHHCDTCRATTGWAYVLEQPPVFVPSVPVSPVAVPPVFVDQPEPTPVVQPEASPAPAATPPPAPTKTGVIENRLKGRAPIRMSIKITRNKYGRQISDICETINVSRTGVYFSTDQNYDTGEAVQIVLPYHPDSVSIPVPARVVRLDTRPDTYKKRVAVHLAFGTAEPH